MNPAAIIRLTHNITATILPGWTPANDLETGLRETVEWFAQSPDSPLRRGAPLTAH